MKNILFPNKCKMFFDSIILCLLTSSIAIFPMDQAPSKKMINLQLDGNIQYPIEKWKVRKESNTLRECYYSQGKKSPILVPGISSDEIALFSTALDKNIDAKKADSFSAYFDGLGAEQKRMLTNVAGQHGANGTKKLCAVRLTSQLADKWLTKDLVRGIRSRIPEHLSILMYIKSSMMMENVCKKIISQCPVPSYSQRDSHKKRSVGGAPICMPKVEGIDINNFNAIPSEILQGFAGGRNLPMVLFSKKHHLFLAEPEAILICEHNMQKGEVSYVGRIIHSSPIRRAYLSADGNWLVTSASVLDGHQDSKLILTLLDKSHEHYLSQTILVPMLNVDKAPCFNNASTLLAFNDFTQGNKINIFSLQDKKVMSALQPPMGMLCQIPGVDELKKYNPLPLELAFNKDDTRLVACLENSMLHDKSTIMIWDTSDLNNVKELQLIHFPIKQSLDATITFSYPQQDTVAVSTEYTTFFFDVLSGEFLAETQAIKGQEEAVYAAACSVPHSPIMCIAKNINPKSSCINFYHTKSGKCLDSILLDEPKIAGIGVTQNSRSLVATFENYKAITIELLSVEGNAPILELSKEMKLVDFYAMLQLYRAKRENRAHSLSPALFEYIKHFGAEVIYNNILEKTIFVDKEKEETRKNEKSIIS